MTGFNSKRRMAEDKMDYEQFYQHERTKLLGILKYQIERLGLVYNEESFRNRNNKELKAGVAAGYKFIEMKENVNA
jgi:hypothetical protein